VPFTRYVDLLVIFQLLNKSSLLSAPTHGNLRGPIPQGPQRFREHACLPWRLMARYKWLQLKSNEDGDECIAGECPSRESGSSAGRTVSGIEF